MWYLYYEKGRPAIRRWICDNTGKRIKLERLPSKLYKNDQDLPALVIRLNAEATKEKTTRSAITIKHAFINPKLVDNYLLYRQSLVPTTSKACTEVHYLKKHFLNVCPNNTNEWFTDTFATQWSTYLLKQDLAPDTLRQIIRAVNHFVLYLHKQRPNEIPKQSIDPLNKHQFNKLNASRLIKPRYIEEDHYVSIIRVLPESLIPIVKIAKLYGLRRNEILGLSLEDIKEDGLDVSRQLKTTTPSYGPLKGRDVRTVPHWLCSAQECYNAVSAIKIVHPDTITHVWSTLVKQVGYFYRFHDLRHTFCTNVWKVDGLLPRDVQLACGHKNIATTMNYSHLLKKAGRKVFKPNS